MVSGGSGGGNKGRTQTHSYDAAVKARHALVCFSRIHASCSFQNASISATLSAGTDQTMWMQGRFSSTLRVDMLGGDEAKEFRLMFVNFHGLFVNFHGMFANLSGISCLV